MDMKLRIEIKIDVKVNGIISDDRNENDIILFDLKMNVYIKIK